MLIRKILIIFSIGFLLGFLNIYFFRYVSPYNQEKLDQLIQDKEIEEDQLDRFEEELINIKEEGLIFSYLSSNAYVGAVIALFAFTFIFAAIHLSADKLFFKKFFEPPSTFDAFRRGFLIGLGILFIIMFRLIGLGIVENILVVIVLMLLEIIFINYLKKDLINLSRKWELKLKEVKSKIEKNIN
jgi:hypothetical protein